ncbi:MAG TPA: hypothetical protein VJW77_05455 [Terriglobia bacterium]|nr:hypothetical protein [Terriglobia bacterium]
MDLIVMIGMVFAISKTIRGILGGGQRNSASQRPGAQKKAPDPSQGRTARDPVCGMFVSTEVSHRLVENGQTLHFCSQSCMESYEKQHARR